MRGVFENVYHVENVAARLARAEVRRHAAARRATRLHGQDRRLHQGHRQPRASTATPPPDPGQTQTAQPGRLPRAWTTTTAEPSSRATRELAAAAAGHRRARVQPRAPVRLRRRAGHVDVRVDARPGWRTRSTTTSTTTSSTSPPWAQLSPVPLTQFNAPDATDPANVKVYGDAVWNRWIDEHFGAGHDPAAPGSSRCSRSPKSFAPGAYDAALRERGTSFFDAFTRFAADTAEWRAANSRVRGGRLVPGRAARVRDADGPSRSSSRPSAAAASSGGLDHTAYALINVEPRGQRRAEARRRRCRAASRGRDRARRPHRRRGERRPSVVGSSACRSGGTRHGRRSTNPGELRAHHRGADLTRDDLGERLLARAAATGTGRATREADHAARLTDFTAPRLRSRSPERDKRGVSRGARAEDRPSPSGMAGVDHAHRGAASARAATRSVRAP